MKGNDIKYFNEAKQTRQTRLTRNVWNSLFCGEFIPGLVFRMNAIQKHRGPDGYFAN